MAPYSVEDAYVPREIVFFDLEGLDLDLCSPSAASVDLCTEWPYWDRAVYRLGLAGERPVVVQPEDRRELWVRHVEGPWDALDGIDHLADPYLTLHRVIEVDYDCTLVGADERGYAFLDDASGLLRRYDLASGREEPRIEIAVAVWGARTVAVGGRELILAWTDRELLVHDVPTGTNLCPIPVGEPVLDASVAEPGILIVATEHGLYAYRLSPDASSARGPGGMGKNN